MDAGSEAGMTGVRFRELLRYDYPGYFVTITRDVDSGNRQLATGCCGHLPSFRRKPESLVELRFNPVTAGCVNR